MITGLFYLVFLACTGSMTADFSLCLVNDSSVLVPLTVQYVLGSESIMPGEVYGFYDYSQIDRQFVVHRVVSVSGDWVILMGDSSNVINIVPRNRIVFRVLVPSTRDAYLRVSRSVLEGSVDAQAIQRGVNVSSVIGGVVI